MTGCSLGENAASISDAVILLESLIRGLQIVVSETGALAVLGVNTAVRSGELNGSIYVKLLTQTRDYSLLTVSASDSKQVDEE